MVKPSGHHEMRGCKPDGPKNQWAKVLVAPTSGVLQRTEHFIRRVGTARLEEMVKSTWYLDLRVGDITKVDGVHVAIYASETEGQRKSTFFSKRLTALVGSKGKVQEAI